MRVNGQNPASISIGSHFPLKRGNSFSSNQRVSGSWRWSPWQLRRRAVSCRPLSTRQWRVRHRVRCAGTCSSGSKRTTTCGIEKDTKIQPPIKHRGSEGEFREKFHINERFPYLSLRHCLIWGGILEPRTLGYMKGASVSTRSRSSGIKPFSKIERTPSSDLSFHRKPVRQGQGLVIGRKKLPENMQSHLSIQCKVPFRYTLKPGRMFRWSSGGQQAVVCPCISPEFAPYPHGRLSHAGREACELHRQVAPAIKEIMVLCFKCWHVKRMFQTCFSKTSSCTSGGEKLRLKSNPHSPTATHSGLLANSLIVS